MNEILDELTNRRFEILTLLLQKKTLTTVDRNKKIDELVEIEELLKDLCSSKNKEKVKTYNKTINNIENNKRKKVSIKY